MATGFDPRRHSTVAFAVSERQPVFYGTKGEILPMKSFMVGPNCPDTISSLRSRPSTAPASNNDGGARTFLRKNSNAHPRFIDVDGQWVQSELPTLIADSQAQGLCATGAVKASMTSTLTGKQAQGSGTIKPLCAVHTYNDISPVTTAEYVRDGDASDPVATQRLGAIVGNAAPNVTGSMFGGAPKMERSNYTLKATAMGSTEARVASIDHFWNRHNGSYNLAIKDLDRVEELGRNVVAGTPNTRLVHGRWRYIARPVEGDVIYTDYYGRYADEHCNYYGRRYEMGSTEFMQNKLVGDGDYTKVQASMQGIHTLRTRPGFSLDATIASAVPSTKLEKLSPYATEQRGIHRIHQHARLRPGTAPVNM